MKEPAAVLFASCSEDLIPSAIENLRSLFPRCSLQVVSEFPPEAAECRWIPYHVSRTFEENWSLCRASLRNYDLRVAAIVLQPRMPYWRMRLIAMLIAPHRVLAFNENLGHFWLRPLSFPTLTRHARWRLRNYLVWQSSPGGAVYTLAWRLRHPRAFRRQLLALAARMAGDWIALRKRNARAPRPAEIPPSTVTGFAHKEGLSIAAVIPSRNGRTLLMRALPEVVAQLATRLHRIVVVDNGSQDGTAAWLASEYPAILVACTPEPLSFARAVNIGIRAAASTHVCLLNNDMEVETGFFDALSHAFAAVPDLFCATAQIFLPEGLRREETGKAVMTPEPERGLYDLPLRCDLPIEGEDGSYVLYGSGGCSLFDRAKLEALGGLDETFAPAYVEDLDLGVRAWQRNWPTVFVAGARALHRHRSTTAKYFSGEQLQAMVETNYLRFLVRTIGDRKVFRALWGAAIRRLNARAALPAPDPAAMSALQAAVDAPGWLRAQSPAVLPDQTIFALGNGTVTVFPGRARRDKPLILIACPYLPFPLSHGGAVRMFNLLRRAARDFDQVLISFVEEQGPVPAELLACCVEVVTVSRFGSHALPSTARPEVVEEFDSPSFHAALRQTIRKWSPAIAQLEFTQMAQYAPDCAPARTILVEHDITFDLLHQLASVSDDWEQRRQFERTVRFEKQAWKQVDRVVVMSEKDRLTVASANAVTLPNGVDTGRFLPGQAKAEPHRLLFVGSFAHLPNVLAVEFFLREVWPFLEPSGAKLHIIAGSRYQLFTNRRTNGPSIDLNRPNVEVEGLVADVRPAYERAAIVIAPLVVSAGTNIKIMEAMAIGKAIVSTPAGINGLDLRAGRDLEIAASGPEMVKIILELLNDSSRRETLGRNARETAVRDFSWDVIAERQEALYRELLSPRHFSGCDPASGAALSS